MISPATWLAAFVATFAVEAPVVLALTRASETSAPRRLALVLFAQLATHPLVWYVFPYIVGLRGSTATLLSEACAWLGEAALYALAMRDVTFARALGVSAVANGASVLAGLVLRASRVIV
jgi:membrane-bound metal-dependent hydrolase YbcI (DUF457 family)